MITEQDLQAAIAECQGERNPNANTCIKLAAFYTIKEHLFPEDKSLQSQDKNLSYPDQYSYAPPPDQKTEPMIAIDSDTDFARVIDGREQQEIWPVLDELMDTIRDMQPRLYRMVMDKLRE